MRHRKELASTGQQLKHFLVPIVLGESQSLIIFGGGVDLGILEEKSDRCGMIIAGSFPERIVAEMGGVDSWVGQENLNDIIEAQTGGIDEGGVEDDIEVRVGVLLEDVTQNLGLI
jgi:hypothetical protein